MCLTACTGVGEGEIKAAVTSGRIPNTNALGEPRSVLYSTDKLSSSSEAEQALQVGKHNPAGATETPTYRLAAPRNGATWQYAGNVEGARGSSS